MANLFQPSLQRALDSNANPVSGAKLHFYTTETTTPATVFTDIDGNVPATNPVIADSAGKFEPVYLDADTTYRIKLTNADGSLTIYDVDPVRGYDEGMVSSELATLVAAAEAAAELAGDKAEAAAASEVGAQQSENAAAVYAARSASNANRAALIASTMSNDQPASTLAAGEEDAIAIDATTSNTAKGYWNSNPGKETEGPITALWAAAVLEEYEGEMTLRSAPGDLLKILPATFTPGAAFTVYIDYYHVAGAVPLQVASDTAGIVLRTVDFSPDDYYEIAFHAPDPFNVPIGTPVAGDRHQFTMRIKPGDYAWSFDGDDPAFAEHLDWGVFTEMLFYGAGAATVNIRRILVTNRPVSNDDIRAFRYDGPSNPIKATFPIGIFRQQEDEGIDRYREPAQINLGFTGPVDRKLVVMMARSVAADVLISGSPEVPCMWYQRFIEYDRNTETIASDSSEPTPVYQAPNWPTGGHVQSIMGVRRSFGDNRGRLEMVFSQLEGPTLSFERSVYSCYSDDLGLTYSTPIKILDGGDLGGPDGNYILAGPLCEITEFPADHAIDLAFPVNVATGCKMAYKLKGSSTWALGPFFTGTPATYQPNECAWCMMPNGDMFISARVQQGAFDVQQTRYTYHWDGVPANAPTFVAEMAGYEGAAVAAGCVQLDPDGYLGEFGRIMMTYAINGGGYERHGGYVAYTEDGGVTIRDGFDMHRRLRPRSYMTVLPMFGDGLDFMHVSEPHLQENTNGYTSCSAVAFRAPARILGRNSAGAPLPPPPPPPPPHPEQGAPINPGASLNFVPSDANTTAVLQGNGDWLITKVGGGVLAYDTAARSATPIVGDFLLRVRPLQTNAALVAGVSLNPTTNIGYTDIEYGLGLGAFGDLSYSEYTAFGSMGAYADEEAMWVMRTSGVIRYFRGEDPLVLGSGTILRTPSSPYAGDYYADIALATLGAQVLVRFVDL